MFNIFKWCKHSYEIESQGKVDHYMEGKWWYLEKWFIQRCTKCNKMRTYKFKVGK